MRSWKVLVAAIVAGGLAVVAPLRDSAAQSPVKIRLAWVVPVANWASILPEKPDLLHHQGKSYVLEPVRFQGTPPMISAMAINDLEIGNLAYSSFSLAVENANLSDLRIIADEFQDGVPGYYSDEFFVAKDSPIKTVEDLKGKVLATNAVGSAVDIAMRAMLRKHNMQDKRDVTIIEAAFPNMPAMLADHKVDLFPGVLPFSVNPAIRGAARTLFSQKEAVGTTQMIVWAARSGFIQKNRAALVDFMEDMLRAERWFLAPANHKDAVAIAAKVSKQPEANFDSWLFTKQDYYRDPDGKPNLDALQANIDLQKELGFLKAGFDAKKYADLSIVEDAAKRLK
ncbi:MAG TPA: ABC transporter substrate-binding protein [Burkholderiales bacterium]|nr:ABC transporter substrate-binding protein [Alphaproteobacteria bacterium]HUN70593.1 ABC transporter substrate-binding protein [Burkholderiales bacterium]